MPPRLKGVVFLALACIRGLLEQERLVGNAEPWIFVPVNKQQRRKTHTPQNPKPGDVQSKLPSRRGEHCVGSPLGLLGRPPGSGPSMCEHLPAWGFPVVQGFWTWVSPHPHAARGSYTRALLRGPLGCCTTLVWPAQGAACVPPGFVPRPFDPPWVLPASSRRQAEETHLTSSENIPAAGFHKGPSCQVLGAPWRAWLCSWAVLRVLRRRCPDAARFIPACWLPSRPGLKADDPPARPAGGGLGGGGLGLTGGAGPGGPLLSTPGSQVSASTWGGRRPLWNPTTL